MNIRMRAVLAWRPHEPKSKFALMRREQLRPQEEPPHARRRGRRDVDHSERTATEKPPAGISPAAGQSTSSSRAGTGDHVLHVRQQGGRLNGTHQGDFLSREVSGSLAGDEASITSSIGEVHGAALSYRFNGRLNGDTTTGTVDKGEYLKCAIHSEALSFRRDPG